VGLLSGDALLDRSRIFRGDLAALERCDGCVALLTGADHDSGTCGELGYMYAKNKPCFGISDDVRRMNNLVWGLCGEGKQIATNIDDLLSLIARVWGD